MESAEVSNTEDDEAGTMATAGFYELRRAVDDGVEGGIVGGIMGMAALLRVEPGSRALWTSWAGLRSWSLPSYPRRTWS